MGRVSEPSVPSAIGEPRQPQSSKAGGLCSLRRESRGDDVLGTNQNNVEVHTLAAMTARTHEGGDKQNPPGIGDGGQVLTSLLPDAITAVEGTKISGVRIGAELSHFVSFSFV